MTKPLSESPAEFDPETILFHDQGLLAVDKPAGIPVHTGTGHERALANLIEEWVSCNPRILAARPGKKIHPVHRLDLEASGVLLFAFTPAVARRVQRAFAEGRVHKRYLAVVAGPCAARGRIKGKVRSRLRGVMRHLPAEISYRRVRGDPRLSIVEVEPQGGRSHQIRALFARAGRPLAGDLRYGRPKPARQFLEKFGQPCLLLHAVELVLPADILGREMRIEAPLPPRLLALCAAKGWKALQENTGRGKTKR